VKKLDPVTGGRDARELRAISLFWPSLATSQVRRGRPQRLSFLRLTDVFP
jgi:hypothetical protein